MIGSQVAIAIENARLYEEVVEERDRTETILEQAFAGIMVIDSEMRIVTMNPGAEIITGYTAQEVLGKRLPEFFGPDMWSEGSLVQAAMASGERVAPAEAMLVGGKGARDVLLGVTSLGDGYLLSFADITYLKEVDRLKSDIVANVSHELRAPLASIKAYTELLLDDVENGDKATSHKFLSVIDRESDGLAGLIGDLLDISRLEQRRVQMQKGPLSISAVVNDVLSVLDVPARERNIAIHLDLPAHLPMILANRDLMMTLIKNLLSNAIKCSHEGGQVNLAARAEGDDLVLNVVNRGIGISSEELPHLFEKFYRTETARKAGIKGTGLGLVLVKEAVQAHDGTIEVESELGVGTRFTVTLPVKGKPG
jgi:two-component system phosphate regulon sensor histidine kinase PhoR